MGKAIAIAKQVRQTGAVGLAGASRADHLRAIAAELDQEASAYIAAASGSLLVSESTAEKIHQQRTETGAALITTRNGVLLFGHGADEHESCFALDYEACEFGITGCSARTVRLLGDNCPAVAALAQLLADVLNRAAETISQRELSTAAPAGRHERLGLTVWGAHPDDGLCRLQIGDAWVSFSNLALTGLCSELFALQFRLVADAIGQRQQLEAALSQTPSREAIALA